MIRKDTYLKSAETLGCLDLYWQPGPVGSVYICEKTANKDSQCVHAVNNFHWKEKEWNSKHLCA